MEIKLLKEEIKNIQEPRRVKYGNVRHKLEDIIIIGVVFENNEKYELTRYFITSLTNIDEFAGTVQNIGQLKTNCIGAKMLCSVKILRVHEKIILRSI